MTIIWREKMAVDDGIIDQDHKHLIDIINRFENTVKEGLSLEAALEILYALKFYASTHFQREEKLQTLIEFPFCDAHKKEHQELLETLDTIISEVKFSNDESHKKTARDTALLLRDWLVDHILHNDLRMRPFVDALHREGRHMKALANILPS